ncbi:VWA domain-containing protein [Auraticoccus monumenti]|uniref:VWA domain containing CoxE-like protein n=1 Tax=Auraticoccus monumenti TaxID=675864 RepID=A0A1G7ERZ6_9ACTN|nr:VWA domain-containing protein [Auraticoccus monumenti]SDE66413.1 VWA domain containing CoxE-like protein [Auraticoccus monumenti]
MSEEDDRVRRWRLVLGGESADGTGAELEGDDLVRDRALSQLYDGERRGRGGLGASAPSVARWLGDIRSHFPTRVVQVMQADAMDRLGLHQLLTEPETLASVQPDINLVTTLMGLRGAIPESSKEAARQVVRTVTDELQARLAAELVQAVSGALDRVRRTSRPRPADIDWGRTVAANLKHWLPEHQTVVPERLVGHARRRSQVERHIILCIDQSGSMASSIVWSGVFGAVLASLRSVRTSLVVFDTEVVDLTDELDDPVDVLFGIQLGGGTDINRALAYCQTLIEQPEETVLVLLSDLLEGGIAEEMLRRARQVHDSGAVMVALLALSDEGAPYYDAEHAQALTALGVPAFACTPDVFPDLMAAAIQRHDLGEWAASHDIVTAGSAESD